MLRHPILTRADEQSLGKRIEAAERRLIAAAIETRVGREELSKLVEEVRARRVPPGKILRNAEREPAAAAAQRSRLLKVLGRAPAPRLRGKWADRIVELQLRTSVLFGLEAAIRERNDDPSVRAHLREMHLARLEIEQTRKLFVESNLRLVVSIAKNFRSTHLALFDLVQEGNVGLIHAVEKFDYRKGFRLSTYATWWIKQAIDRALSERGTTIRIPVHLVEKRAKVLRARRELEQRLDETPTSSQIAIACGLPVSGVEQVLRIEREPLSLNGPLHDDSDAELGESVARDDGRSAIDEIVSARLVENAHELLATLTDRERKVLDMRFGLNGAEERTLKEVGKALSLTRERIRQIEAAALRKLRVRCEQKRYRPEYVW